MTTRRTFLSALAALPIVRRLPIAKPEPELFEGVPVVFTKPVESAPIVYGNLNAYRYQVHGTVRVSKELLQDSEVNLPELLVCHERWRRGLEQPPNWWLRHRGRELRRKWKAQHRLERLARRANA